VGEEGEQSGSAPRATALHRPGGDVEHAGGFGDGVSLHVHQDEGRALIGRQCAEGLQELAVEVVALGRRLRRLVRFQELFEPLVVVDRRGLP
jgi:hypothetical protein